MLKNRSKAFTFPNFSNRNLGAFTLVELLIVIGILAVLATATVLILNPAQFLAQSRDSVRISDIDTLDKSIALYQTNGGDFVPANIVYISLPDDAPVDETGHNNCPTIHAIVPDPLPILPSGWSYRCATQANLRSITGDGWIPLDFTSAPPSSLVALPIDPINSDTDQRYYTYIGGSWNLTARMESTKFLQSTNISDGGNDPSRYEAGSDLSHWSTASGLVGYWPMDEGSGTVVRDASSYGNVGTYSASGISWLGLSNCKASNCPTLNGASTTNIRVSTGGANGSVINNLGQVGTSYSISLWFKTTIAQYQSLTEKWSGSGCCYPWAFRNANGGVLFAVYDGTRGPSVSASSSTYADGKWHHAVAVRDGAQAKLYLYVDNVRFGPTTDNTIGNVSNSLSPYLGSRTATIMNFNGSIDDYRIYNRALSASEISAIYNATQ